jgi:hypothetical protein
MYVAMLFASWMRIFRIDPSMLSPSTERERMSAPMSHTRFAEHGLKVQSRDWRIVSSIGSSRAWPALRFRLIPATSA